MARPPGAKANLLITFTLGDVIKGPSLLLSVSMHMWKSRKAGERATESSEAEEKSRGAGGKGYEAGIPCCYCGICWTCPVNMKGQSGLRLGESSRKKHAHAGETWRQIAWIRLQTQRKAGHQSCVRGSSRVRWNAVMEEDAISGKVQKSAEGFNHPLQESVVSSGTAGPRTKTCSAINVK